MHVRSMHYRELLRAWFVLHPRCVVTHSASLRALIGMHCTAISHVSHMLCVLHPDTSAVCCPALLRSVRLSGCRLAECGALSRRQTSASCSAASSTVRPAQLPSSQNARRRLWQSWSDASTALAATCAVQCCTADCPYRSSCCPSSYDWASSSGNAEGTCLLAAEAEGMCHYSVSQHVQPDYTFTIGDIAGAGA